MSALPNYIPDVVTAVQNANLNVNPQQEGSNIIIPLPKITKVGQMKWNNVKKVNVILYV